MKRKRFIIVGIVLGMGVFVWASYRAVSGTTLSGRAPRIEEVPHVDTALDWLRPRGSVEYVVHEGIRGPFGIVTGEASGDVAAAANSLGLSTGFAGPNASKTLSYLIRNNGDHPERFVINFGEDDPVYSGTVGGCAVEVYYRDSDHRFTARIIRSNDVKR